MASVKTKIAVGVFVIFGFSLVALAVLWLGLSSQFETGKFYAAYFDESIQGLDKDSPVKYRGVSIGRVDSVRVAPDATLIEVILKIESGMKLGPDMVAQLKSVGITGIMFVELDRKKPGDPDYHLPLSFTPSYPVVETRPSQLVELIGGISEIVETIKELDFKGLSEEAKSTLKHFNTAVDDADVAAVSKDIRNSLSRFDAAFQKIELAGNDISRITRSGGRTLGHIDATLDEADRFIVDSKAELMQALAQVSDLIGRLKNVADQSADLIQSGDGRLSDLHASMTVTLQRLEITSEQLKDLTERLAAQPSQLLFSTPPSPRHLPAAPGRGNPSAAGTE